MGRLAEYLDDTFSPSRENERAFDWRLFRQRMIFLAAVILFCLLCAGLHTLSRITEPLTMQGTWVLQEDLADGFHPEDTCMEYKDGTLYCNGSYYGTPVKQDGRLIIRDTAPAGREAHTLSFHGNTMKLTYRATPAYSPNTNSTGSSTGAEAYGFRSISELNNRSAMSGQMIEETYIRISMECGLSEEERSSLY